MSKRILSLTLAVAMLFLVGCTDNVSREEYDKVVAEIEKLKNEQSESTDESTNEENESPFLDLNLINSMAATPVKSSFLIFHDDRVYYHSNKYGGINSMKTDGSDRQCLADDSSRYLLVVDDRIYYTSSSDNSSIYSMKTDGSDKQKVNNDSSSYIRALPNTLPLRLQFIS